MVRFKNSRDLSGSPYWETEDDLFPPTPDLDKDPDSTWLIWMRIDYEERESWSTGSPRMKSNRAKKTL